MKLTIFLGSLIGFFLGYVVKRWRSSVHKGPSSTKIQQQIYYDSEQKKCYQFTPIIHVCPPSVQVGELDHSSDDDDSS